MIGKIYKINAGFFYVWDDKYNSYTLRGSGNLRNTNQIPVVGDNVKFQPDGFILEILERKNVFLRPKIANIDQAIIVTSIVEPKYNELLLVKFLSVFEFQNITPIIVFTKSDISSNSYLSDFTNYGYLAYEINNGQAQDKKDFIELFKNKCTVFAGQTGAGKTTLINSLSNSTFSTQAISKSLGRGKHTTRITQIVRWNDGELIDTPGFSSMQITLNKSQLAKSFHAFRKYSINCKFNSCIHYKENDCGIKSGLKNNTISPVVYTNYLRLLKETMR